MSPLYLRLMAAVAALTAMTASSAYAQGQAEPRSLFPSGSAAETSALRGAVRLGNQARAGERSAVAVRGD